MKLYNPKTGETISEINHYYDCSVQFDTSHLEQKKADTFRATMEAWDWSHDDELFWLEGLNAENGQAHPEMVSIDSWHLCDRIRLLFFVLDQLFPGLEAVARLRYGASNTLWEMGISNHGGYLTISLKDGKIDTDDLPIF